MKKEPIYIFFHIPKTAGATFRYHLIKNFKSNELLEISLKDVGYSTHILPTSKDRIKPTKKLLKNYDLDRIKVVYGHGVPYGIHKYFKNREARYFTFMRKSTKRLPSIYNHKIRNFNNKKLDSKEMRINLKNTLLVNNGIPEFSKWLEKKYNTKPENEHLTTYNYLKIFGYKLKDFFFIGRTSEYNKDSLYLFKLLGVNKFFLDRNISLKRYEGIIDTKIINKKTIKSKKLFEQAMQIRSKQIERKEYLSAVKYKGMQKKFTRLITQFLFAPRSTMKRILNPDLKSEI